MIKAYKYQRLMNDKGIKIPCPSKNCQEIEQEAFRWGHTPLENELNFLPNFLYNEKKQKAPMRFNSEEDLKNCGNCSLSFFDNFEYAKAYWFSESKFMERLRPLLQYTHILKGFIKKEMGVATEKRPHFEFFEYEGIELREQFVVLCELKKD